MEHIKKYDIWLVDLEPTKGNEQAGTRPCLVIQNNDFFRYQGTSIVLPITGKIQKSGDFKIVIEGYKSCGLDKKSMILTFQIRSADKSRFIKKIGKLNDLELRKKIKNSLEITLDLEDEFLL